MNKTMKYNLKPLEFDLRTWRKNYGVSTRKLGEITGLDYSYLCRLENGAHTASPEVAVKMFIAMEAYEPLNRRLQHIHQFSTLNLENKQPDRAALRRSGAPGR